MSTICYLCGKDISDDEKISSDHVAPKLLIDREQPRVKEYYYGRFSLHKQKTLPPCICPTESVCGLLDRRRAQRRFTAMYALRRARPNSQKIGDNLQFSKSSLFFIKTELTCKRGQDRSVYSWAQGLPSPHRWLKFSAAVRPARFMHCDRSESRNAQTLQPKAIGAKQ